MAKQTLKARRSLKKGSLRRKTPAPKAETQKKSEPVAMIDVVAVANDDYWRQYAHRMANAYVPRETEHGHREMIAPDIGCMLWPPPGSLRINRSRITGSRPEKPSLFERLKAWWRR